MKEHGKAMVMAAFVADSLALGAHWIYNTEDISRTFGRMDRLQAPGPGSYHPAKRAGEFTHYGDQTLALLESVAQNDGFDLYHFSTLWRALFDGYDGYVDEATRATLSGFAAGKGPQSAGAPSDDLGGAARIPPLVHRYRNDLIGVIDASRSQTHMTHTDPVTVDSAEFFATVAWLVLNGMPPVAAMQTVAQDQFANSPVYGWVKEGIASKDTGSVTAIGKFGQSCRTAEAFPGVVHLIARYQEDLKKALVQSVMAGGDSAARGMLAGMVIGAHSGWDGLPKEWVSGLKEKEKVLSLLERIS